MPSLMSWRFRISATRSVRLYSSQRLSVASRSVSVTTRTVSRPLPLAEVAAANPQRLKVVSKFYPDANLFEPPPPYVKGQSQGRPRVKGKELPKPAQVVHDTVKRPVLSVAWYGGERRRVEVVTGSGWWYQSGRPLLPVRWVFVRDRTGTHRDEYFFTTDVTMSPKTVIETYTGRWNIEISHPDHPSSDSLYRRHRAA